MNIFEDGLFFIGVGYAESFFRILSYDYIFLWRYI